MRYNCSTAREEQRAAAFTLVEMLLVLVLIGIISAVVLPNLARSIRGNRMRFAVRSVVMAGRYARSMAVMKQRDILLEFNIDKSSLSVKEVRVKHNYPEKSGSYTVTATNRPAADDNDSGAEKPPPVTVVEKTLLTRKLNRVRIDYVDSGDTEIRSGVKSVIFYSNGRCDPYTVQLEDENETRIEIEVDALASVKTRRL